MKQWEHCRNYEISVWTLLDNYITTLKSGDPILTYDSTSSVANWEIWPQARAQGLILNGIMEINIDGTLTLSFDIPMYLFINGKKVENPNWYNVINENILVNMRKIKVIFDKYNYLEMILDNEENSYTNDNSSFEKDSERRSGSVFEFIITKVLETHESDNLMCHVECEGLAFHELGKVGYKRSLSTDELNNEYYEWSIAEVGTGKTYPTKKAKEEALPVANLLYWMKKAGIEPLPTRRNGRIIIENLKPTQWYYEIRMVHIGLLKSGTDPIYDNIIYEDGFVSDWTSNGKPLNFIEARERYRLVNIEESNLYNITLDLAEAFLVFCRYEYLYNNNYNIVGRVIVFYNNILLETQDVLTLMYPNSITRIHREMDSTDISTKMFVRSVMNSDLYNGEVNILDCSANKSKEDYVMNFKYLHDIGTISDLQYESIDDYEIEMRLINDELIPKQAALRALQDLKTDADAQVTSLTELIDLDKERITENEAFIYAIDVADGDADGYITRDFRNPEVLNLLKDSSDPDYDMYYVLLNLNDKCRGIVPETLELYKEYWTTSKTKTYYGIGYKALPSKPTASYALSIPEASFSENWVDYPITFKGTIGAKPDKTDLPKNPENLWCYTAMDLDYPSNYRINIGNFLVYSDTKKEWEVHRSGSATDGGRVNKGTIGRGKNIYVLPDAPEKGWIYLVITPNSIIKMNNSNETCALNDLILYNGTQWQRIAHPNDSNDTAFREAEAKEKTVANIKNLYTKSGNTYTRTTDSKIHDDKTYYVRKIDYTNRGFYIYTKVMTELRNGLCSAKYTATRYGSFTPEIDYMKNAKLVYYITKSSTAPAAPTIESPTTPETEIESSETALDKWSDKLPAPEPGSDLSSYKMYKSWEITSALGRRIFYGFNSLGESYSTAKDASNKTITSGFSEAKNTFLKPEDKLTGIYKYDKYHNLDKVTGLFIAKKSGSYSSYKTVNDAPTSFNESNLGSFSDEYPSAEQLKNIYVLTKETIYIGENVVYGYRYKYYNDKGVVAIPDGENDGNKIESVTRIFYLNTKNPTIAPSAPNDDEVSNANVKDLWTTGFPTSNDSTYKYYLGWKIMKFDASVSYVYERPQITDEFKIKLTTVDDSSAIPRYVYAIFKYKPDLYYEKIKDSWTLKLYSDMSLLDTLKDRQDQLTITIDEVQSIVDSLVEKKTNKISKFERMMGAALRESYWQPEDEYQNYGTKYEEDFTLLKSGISDLVNTGTFFIDSTNKLLSNIGWDSCLLKEEQKLYYEYGVNRTKTYYPCIDLSLVPNFLNDYFDASEKDRKLYSFFFNPTTETIGEGESEYDVRYCLQYAIGSEAKFVFVRNRNNGSVIPALLLIGTETLSTTELKRLYETGKLGKLILKQEGNKAILSVRTEDIYTISKEAWLNWDNTKTKYKLDRLTLKKCNVVYPRIVIPSLKLKNNSEELVLMHNNIELKNYEDYYVFTKTYYHMVNSSDLNKLVYRDIDKVLIETIRNRDSRILTSYTITIKPEYFLEKISLTGNTFGTFKLFYALSNADIGIYLDAKKILNENAYPKVSYEVEVSKWSPTLLERLYNKLAQIVMINDVDLKLLHTFGYISGIKLDLDHEEKDSIEVKNYKTKFEDLFSKIVAETELMHKNSYNIGAAGALAAGGSVDAPISLEGMEATLGDPSIQETLQEFLDKYFDGAEVVQQLLLEMWSEAGAILGSAATSLGSVMSATTENASILAGFRENVAASLTPKVFTGKELPTTFKPGDIWMNEDDGYYAVATGFAGHGGFTRTHDGTLAEIKGANMNIDAEAGTIDILAETQINLMSGGNVYIAANENVDIVGNKAVNIGGTTINMASCNIIGNGYPGSTGGGGIHLVATDYYYTSSDDDEGTLSEGATSRVDVTGEGIEMASKNGIKIMSGAGIDIKSSDDEKVSAMQIDKDKGIWIGSTSAISLFSGTATLEESLASGASVEISGEHILLGVANKGADEATAIELSEKLIILAAGDLLSTIEQNADGEITSFGSSSVSGVQIKKDYIGMAVGSSSNRSLLSIKPTKILFGTINRNTTDYNFMDEWDASLANTTKKYLVPEDEDKEYYSRYEYKNNSWKVTASHIGPEAYTGSYVWLSKDDVYIGSMGNFTLNTNNIKIQSKNLSEKKGASSDSSDYVLGMGFALGNRLLATYVPPQTGESDEDKATREAANPDIGLGFWIDGSGGKHLLVDANEIKLGGDPVASLLTILNTVPYETLRLYKLHDSKDTAPSAPSGYTWKDVYDAEYSSTADSPFLNNSIGGWQQGLPSPANANESGNKYVWSIIQYTYKINESSKYKFMASNPVYEGLVDKLTQKSYKLYKYFTNTPATDTALSEKNSGWTESIPEGSYTVEYYYNDVLCTKGSDITANTNLNTSETPTSIPTVRYLKSDNHTITFYRLVNNVWTEVSEKCMKGYWFIYTEAETGINRWQIATGKVIKKRSNKLLYSRVHVIKNDGTAFNKNLLLESELALMSAAARDAWNIASGSIPVPSVSSSGLVVDGDNVVLGSTGKLMLLGNAEVFIGTSSSNSAVVLNKTGIQIASGADIGIASGGSIEIYAGVSGDSGNNGHITIDSPNFKVQSNPSSGGNYFYVGNTAGTKYIKYTLSGALEIAGKITADSGSIGPWNITSTFIGNSNILKECNIALRYKDTDGGDSASTDYVAFFSGADGSGTASLNLASAKFKIYSSGKFISTSRDSSITGATINDATILSGTITSAEIALATISSGSITTLDIGSSWYLKTGTYYNFIVNNEKIMNSTAGISVRTASGISSGYTDAVFFAGAAGSGTNWDASKNLASAKFRVTSNGEVYLNALMVYDPNNEITGTHVDGYVPIDFSKLNFNLAVSLVSSTWSGNTFTATVKLWGLLNKTLPITTSISNGGAEITGWVSTTSPALYIKCKLLVQINGDSWGLSDSDLTYAVPLGDYYNTIYNAGWKACRDAVVANAVTRYERSAGTYGGSGTTHYIKDGNNYIDVGKNWYTTTGNTYYTLTNIDETP